MKGTAVVAFFQGSQHRPVRCRGLPVLGPLSGQLSTHLSDPKKPFKEGIILHRASLLNQ